MKLAYSAENQFIYRNLKKSTNINFTSKFQQKFSPI